MFKRPFFLSAGNMPPFYHRHLDTFRHSLAQACSLLPTRLPPLRNTEAYITNIAGLSPWHSNSLLALAGGQRTRGGINTNT